MNSTISTKDLKSKLDKKQRITVVETTSEKYGNEGKNYSNVLLHDGVGTMRDNVYFDLPDSDKNVPPGPEAAMWSAVGYNRWIPLNLTADK